MRTRTILTILAKELRETLRDRRTLMLTLGLPVLVYPLVIIGFMRIAESGQEALEAQRSVIAVWGELPADVAAAVAADEDLDVRAGLDLPVEIAHGLADGTLAPASPRERPEREGARRRRRDPADTGLLEEDNPVLRAARDVVARRAADAVIVAWPGLTGAVAGGDAGPLTVYFDSVRSESTLGGDRVREALRDARRSLVEDRQRARGLPPGFSQALEIRARDVAEDERRAGEVLGRIVPYLLLTLAIVGGLYAALDTTAGEKERGTMQTLLCAPVTTAEIVVAKFLGVWILSLVGVATNVASLSLALSRLLPADVPGVDASQMLLAAALLLPVTLTTSALFLALASFARDFRDGQSMLTPLYMGVALPSAVVLLPTMELDAWTAFVPMVNVALLIKGLFLRDVSGELVFLTLVSATLYAALAIAAAVHVFHRETVLVGGRETMRSALAPRAGRGGTPTAGVALVVFAVALVVQFYGSLTLRDLPIPQLLPLLQVLGFLGPLIVAIRWLRLDARRALGLAMPRAWMLALSAVIGLSAWAFAGGVVARLLPPPESLTRAMQRLMQIGDEPMPVWMLWLVLGLVPAICEELFFRGFVYAGLRRLGTWPGLLLTALFFGLAHASIYRLLPTFTLGLIIGVVRWRTGSVLCGMLIHLVNNGLLGTLAQKPDLVRLVGLSPTGTMAEIPTAVGTAVMAGALALLWRYTTPREPAAEAQ
jgi:sodium transport system permease protein